uniref:Tectonic family member 3 n=1 Tax=Strigops habroptila TaxID=2489341 RepID=A0A672TFR0_STRHB
MRGVLLALLLAWVAGWSPGSPPGAAAELAAGAAHRAVPRSEEVASRRAPAAQAGSQTSATGACRGGPAPHIRRRAPRAPARSPAAGGFPARYLPPGARGLRDPGAAESSRLSSGSRTVSQVCVEKSLLFRSNAPYPTDSIPVPGGHDLFCVQLHDSKLNYYQQPQDIKESDFLKFSEKYGRHSFVAPSQVQRSFSPFYRAGDPILIYFDSSSALSTLRQPVKMGSSGLCVDGNPAGFLDSKSTSCTRIFANLSKSCVTDPVLDAASYYRDFYVLKVHAVFLHFAQHLICLTFYCNFTPRMKGNTCNNVVSEVIYEIEFSGTHGIQSVSVWFKVSNISGNSGSALQQRFTLHFWVSAPILPRSGNPGYITGAPLLITNRGSCQMSILRSEGHGSCSPFLRHTHTLKSPFLTHLETLTIMVLFNLKNTLFRCSGVFYFQAVNCVSCCMIPMTLEIQILWTKVGLLSNPEAQILGARYLYHCHPLKVCTVPLTTVVTFTDMTEWPEPPRGQPQIHWKLPFDVFFPFKVAMNLERSYRDDLAGYFFLILIICSILCF